MLVPGSITIASIHMSCLFIRLFQTRRSFKHFIKPCELALSIPSQAPLHWEISGGYLSSDVKTSLLVLYHLISLLNIILKKPHYLQHEKLEARLASSFHDYCWGMITWCYTSHSNQSTSLSDTPSLNLTGVNYSSLQLKSTSPNSSLSSEGHKYVAYRSVETLSVILDDKSQFVKI